MLQGLWPGPVKEQKHLEMMLGQQSLMLWTLYLGYLHHSLFSPSTFFATDQIQQVDQQHLEHLPHNVHKTY